MDPKKGGDLYFAFQECSSIFVISFSFDLLKKQNKKKKKNKRKKVYKKQKFKDKKSVQNKEEKKAIKVCYDSLSFL